MIGCETERFKNLVEDQVRIAMIFYPGHDGDDDGDDDVDDDDDDDDDGHDGDDGDDPQVILKSPEAVLEHLRLSLELSHGHLSSLAASLGLERTRCNYIYHHIIKVIVT